VTVTDGVFDILQLEARAVSPKPNKGKDPTIIAIN
jgi:hypothetical protein